MIRTPQQDLLSYNTFGISQPCRELIVYESEEDAIAIAQELTARPSEPFLILGGGSNLLLTKPFDGLVITADKAFSVEPIDPRDADIDAVESPMDDEVILRCWAGTCFDQVVDWAVEHQLYGLENLSLVPGECGASAIQNIGAYGVEAKDVICLIEAVEIATGRIVEIRPTECDYGYRHPLVRERQMDCRTLQG